MKANLHRCIAAFCLALGAAVPRSLDARPGVTGGTSVSECNWPTTVVWAKTGCTGTLIHPRVVTTASHCDPQTTELISFGEKSSAPSFSIRPTKCVVNNWDLSSPSRDDWAYCVLPDDDRLKKLSIVPPLVGCEAERFLKVDAKVWIVGFGSSSSNSDDFGTKRAAEAPIVAIGTGEDTQQGDLFIPGRGTIVVGNDVYSGCYGDSGGPVFLHLLEGGNDWGFRTVGTTHGSTRPGATPCENPVIWVRIDQIVRHIEADEKIDVTPCTNASGQWDPGPECRNLPTDPGHAGGSWPACATGSVTSMPIDSCGGGASDAGLSGQDAGKVADAEGDANVKDASVANDARGGTAGAGAMGSAGEGGSSPTGGTSGAGGGGSGKTGAGGRDMGSMGGSAGWGSGGTDRPPDSRGADPEAGCSCRLQSSKSGGAPWAALLLWAIASRRLGTRAPFRRSVA